MTKKDYELIAEAISISAKFNFDTSQEPKKLFMVNNIANALVQDNPKFDRERFLEGCGLGHRHDWFPLEVDADQPEQIYWCHGCDATKDSSGGIINQ